MESKGLQNIEMNDEITLSDIIQILKRRKWLLIATFVITVALTLVYLFFIATPTYEITATIKLPKSSSGMSLSGAAAPVLGGSTTSPAVDEQIEIIKSRKVLGNVVKELNLLDYFKNKAKNPEKVELTENQVINMLAKDIVTATSKKNTSLISLTVALDDKELGYKIAQSVIKNYIEVAKELNKDENSYLYDFVRQQLPIVEKELAEVEAKLQEFQKTKSLMPTKEIEQLIQSYSDITKQIVDTQLAIQSAEAQIAELNKRISEVKGLAKAQSYTPTSDQLEELKKELSQLEIQRSSLLLKYTEEAEPVKDVEKQIEIVKKMINDELNRITSAKVEAQDPVLSELYASLSKAITEKESLKAALQGLQKTKNDLDNQLSKYPEIQREYVALQRDFTVKQQTYTVLKAKEEELRLSTAGMNFNVPVVIDEPYIPEKPNKPNKKLTLAVSGVLGIFLGILAAFLREATDQRILDKYQLTSIIGVIPTEFKLPFDSAKNTEAMKELYVKLFGNNFSHEESNKTAKMIHITSVGRITEKNSISYELSKFFSALGKRTLIIDTTGDFSDLIDKSKALSFAQFISQSDLAQYKDTLSFVIKSKDDEPYAFFNETFLEKVNLLKDTMDAIMIITPDSDSAEAKYFEDIANSSVVVIKPSISEKPKLLFGSLFKNVHFVWIDKK
ncbi:GumC family protein [Fervidobacterium pennivorans]|uniref:GumC family protein n=1 Tax=Fervidobacterium pennivorans TaxID=93466 RepID=UPI001436A7E3|nr:GumC family protein [Fervidobacterium pennivorans]QIV77629.1 GumC family protein [Fervidobacterium pennivorans subsp. keratinolyticus]